MGLAPGFQPGVFFTGERSGATGLQYLRARWYDPSSGRFTQVDPFAGVLELPGTQHPYGYGLNNPLTYADPSGRIIKVAITGAIAGGLVGSGLAIPALIGSFAGFAGLGYLAGITVSGSKFQAKDFGIAVGIGAIVGYLTPVVGSTWLGATALGVIANVAQYGLTEFVNCRKPTSDGLAWSALGGLAPGAIGGSYKPPRDFFGMAGYYYFPATKYLFQYLSRTRVLESTVNGFFRSFMATLACNAPSPLPLLKDEDVDDQHSGETCAGELALCTGNGVLRWVDISTLE